MKKLKRMLLIHWHHYEMEMIEFEMINFLTGKTAAGKSTIIDALQLVLLGDTGGGFFNKAANEKSARTLKSYLFGEMGDDGATGFRYLRNERFSSYVALELRIRRSKKTLRWGSSVTAIRIRPLTISGLCCMRMGFRRTGLWMRGAIRLLTLLA